MTKKYIVEVPDEVGAGDMRYMKWVDVSPLGNVQPVLNATEYHEPEPIVMTRKQKEVLDNLRDLNFTNPLYGLANLRDEVTNLSADDIMRAWLNPELIKVEQPKRYQLKFSRGGLLAYDKSDDNWFRSWRNVDETKFTDEEIAELADKFPEIRFEALEKIEVTD